MKRIFDFKCSSCSLEFEEYCEYKQFCICSACGGEATKVIKTPTIKLEGITGSFPSAAWSWDKKHLQQLAREKKQSES